MADSVSQALSQLGRVERLRKLRGARSRSSAQSGPTDAPPLQEFIPQVTPEFSAPTHLRPLTELLEKAVEEPTRFCVSVPPRHGKSETIFHWIAWVLRQAPTTRIAYVSYAHDIACMQVAKIRRVAIRAGIALGDIDREGHWTTAAGGSVTGTGSRGQLTGLGYHLIIVDDPHKNREEAESATIRRKVIEGFENDIESREEPSGTSIVVVHTRWHVGDLIGFLTAERGWKCINLPAVNDNGEALAPHMWPLEALMKHRANPYKWESLYLGRPRKRGSEVFQTPTTCYLHEVPKGRAMIGVDLAYTAKTHSDHSVSLVLLEGPARDGDGARQFWVTDVQRKQVRAPEFALTLKKQRTSWPGSRMRWYAAGVEKGAGDFIVDSGVPLEIENATADKFVRAQPASEAWNDGRIIVPRDAPWSEDFLDVVTRFTGVNDPEDDDVDALAAAYDLHHATQARPPRSLRVQGI